MILRVNGDANCYRIAMDRDTTLCSRHAAQMLEGHEIARLALHASDQAIAWTSFDRLLQKCALEQNSIFWVPLGKGGVPEEQAVLGVSISTAYEAHLRDNPAQVAHIPGIARMIAGETVVPIIPGSAELEALSPDERESLRIMQSFGFRGGFTASFPQRGAASIAVFASCSLVSSERAAQVFSAVAPAAITAVGYFLDGLAVRALHDDPHFVALSGRESECLQWVALGQTTTQIGTRLGLTDRTVNDYLTNAMGKLRASNRAHACTRLTLLRELA